MSKHRTQKARRQLRVQRVVSQPFVEQSADQEINRMKTIMAHYRKLSLTSREFVTWLFVKYQLHELPIRKAG